MKPRILHFRLSDDDGKPAPKGGLTVAVLPYTGGVRVGVSVCHPLDNYDRRRGAETAIGRAERGTWLRHGCPHPLSFCVTAEAAVSGAARAYLMCIQDVCTWLPQCCSWVGGPFSHVIDRAVAAVLLGAEESMQASGLSNPGGTTVVVSPWVDASGANEQPMAAGY